MTEVDGTVTLREITKDNLRAILALKVAPHQEHFVAPNVWSFAEAFFEPDFPRFRAVYVGDTPVGFLMLEYDPDYDAYNLWRFMIDAQHQGRGYGRQALELLFAHVKTLPGTGMLYTSCGQGDGAPGPFYEKLGFVYTGDEEGGELWMSRVIRERGTE